MRSALTIARLSLLEALRREIYLITVFLGFLLFMLPAVVNVFGLGASERVVKDVALTLMGLYANALAVFLGSVAVPGEIERRTAFPVLARPLPRRVFLWGKWLGLMAFITVSLAFLSGVVLGSTATFIHHAEPRLLEGAGCYLLEAAVLSAACVFFSTFYSPALSAVLGVFIYIVGGLSPMFISVFLHGSIQADVARYLKACLPDFQVFHIKDAIVHDDAVPTGYLASVLAYASAWVLLLQLLAEWAFTRRDL